MRQSGRVSSRLQLASLKLTSTVKLGRVVLPLGTSVERQTGVTRPHQSDGNRTGRRSAYLQVVDLIVILVLGIQEPEREDSFSSRFFSTDDSECCS